MISQTKLYNTLTDLGQVQTRTDVFFPQQIFSCLLYSIHGWSVWRNISVHMTSTLKQVRQTTSGNKQYTRYQWTTFWAGVMTLYFLCVGCSHRNRMKNRETSYENKMGFYVWAYSRWGWVAVTLKKNNKKTCTHRLRWDITAYCQ